MNKYVCGGKKNKYYPHFLRYLQNELHCKNYDLHFIYFSNLMKKNVSGENNHFYNSRVYDNLKENEVFFEATRIEKEYGFTFKQAWFPDILQVSKKQNGRKISVPEIELNNLKSLVKKFLFLETLVKNKDVDIIFSDVSPEAEMEFGRVLGYKYNIPVIKAYEGSFLGRTILLKQNKFGKDQLIEFNTGSNYTLGDAKHFIEDFIENKRPPYSRRVKYNYTETLSEKIRNKIKNENNVVKYFLKYLWKRIFNAYLEIETKIFKNLIYDRYDPNKPYLFFGFHLNQESTMVLRSMPYVNQAVLIEMLSRVLPYGYTLYIREHPHWPKTFPIKYLYKCKSFPNVKLLSPKISIHDILANSDGVLVYNSNTGIEALMHGKPVLSFASNIYYTHHPSVLHCLDLYELGEKLSVLINMEVKEKDTINYIKKMMCVSIDLSLGSHFFISKDDSKDKTTIFANYLAKAVDTCLQKGDINN